MNTEKLVDFARDLIRIESLSGSEGIAAERIKKEMLSLGFSNVRTDPFGSVLGRIKGKNSSRRMLFEGHMDTVEVSNSEECNTLLLEQKLPMAAYTDGAQLI